MPPPLRRAAARPRVRIVLRLIAALPGGYAFTAALVALLAAALPLLGLARSEAVVSAAMLGFVLYLLVLLWAFSVRSLAWLWAVLAGGTALALVLFQLIR
ncbi:MULTISPECIES: iron uptake protein [unclassified Polaromonas]|uniref:iron uptake protein n=1 Tax=unclassified Polaromonas TaxID=2638319 RepID=UPI0025F77DC5|nr:MULTISPECIES: iron uptake protein [unclassified Polaromonas]HQS00310.1 iron uptake protein [Polaromonas sp.]HQS42474.1 iron uptake protein [Polaromonas sp.]HQS88254.1 iron uptake protein [Polaromonas sp.]HQT05924.1 iron uptake protein [Polaromonas sp.]